LVSTRTLFAAGLAIIAVICLSAVVVVQQIALQSMLRQTIYMTETVTQQATAQQSSVAVGTPYVLITYYGVTYSGGTSSTCTPSSGNTFLEVKMTIENHGYESGVYLDGDWYVVINSQQYSDYNWACIEGLLNPQITLLNGLSVTGWLLFQVPANHGSFSLVWTHGMQNDVNVHYVHQ
jgi:hypothetical protein